MSFHLPLEFQVVSFLWVSHPKPRMPFCPLSLSLSHTHTYTHTHTHTHTPSSSFIWSPTQYVARSSNHEAADYVVFLQFPVTSSLICPNIFLSTLLSTTFVLCFSLHGQTKFHTHYTHNKNQQDALFYSQFISIISPDLFRSGLLLIIGKYYSVYTAVGMCHAFMLAGC